MSELNIDNFIEKLREEFDDIDPKAILADSTIKDIPDWSSMHALIIIALIDTEYDIMISGDDLRSSETVRDVYNIIEKKLSA